MHNETCQTHLDAMLELSERVKELPVESRRVIAQLLKIDIDLLSVASIEMAIRDAAFKKPEVAPILQNVECIRALIVHMIKAKIEMLGPLAFE